ncbi:MAG: hypothetical protein ABI434_18450 [Burkholderiaceae bacterium]
MRLVAGLMLLVAALVAAVVWDTDVSLAWASDAVVVGSGLGVVLLGWMVGHWLRKRQRRRMLGMRDSALW